MQGDNRLGVEIAARATGTEAVGAQVEALRARLAQFQQALASNAAQTSQLFAKTLRDNIAAVEDQIKRLTATTISQYSTLGDFNIRAIAAMRGQEEAIRGINKALTERDGLLRAGTYGGRGVAYGVTDTAVFTKIDAALTGVARKAREAELAMAFSGIGHRINTDAEAVAREAVAMQRLALTSNEAAVAVGRVGRASAVAGAEAEASWFSRFMRGGRTPVSLFDEGMRGQRGQMASTLGASFRAAGGFPGGGALLAGGVAAAGVVIGAEVINRSTEAMGHWAESVRAGAEAAGMGVPQYSQLQGALQLVGMKADAADTTMRQFARNFAAAVADPESRQAQAFHAMGISQEELVASGGNVLQMFTKFATAWQQTESGANKARAGEVLFGRSLEQVMPLLERGQTGIQALMNEAERLGITLNEQTAQALITTGMKADELSATIHGRAIQAFIDWLPEITAVEDALQKAVNMIGNISHGLATLATNLNNATGGWAGWAAKIAITPWPPWLLHKGMQVLGAEAPVVASAPIPPTTGAVQDTTRAFFASRGYSQTATAAVMGNLQVESGFNPYSGLGTAHQGLAQWDASRWGQLTAQAGTATPSTEQQLQFLDQEIKKRIPGFAASQEPAGELARVFESGIEQSGGQMLGQRVSAAEGFAKRPAGSMDTTAEERQFTRSMELLRAQTQVRNAEYNKQIADAKNQNQNYDAILQEKQKFEESQLSKEREVWNTYANGVARSMGTTIDAVSKLPEAQQPDWYKQLAARAGQFQAQILGAQTAGVQQQTELNHKAAQSAEESARLQIASVRSAEQEILDNTKATTAQKVAAAEGFLKTVVSSYDQMLASAAAAYGTEGVEYKRLQTEKVTAAREAQKQIDTLQEAGAQKQLRDAQRTVQELQEQRTTEREQTTLRAAEAKAGITAPQAVAMGLPAPAEGLEGPRAQIRAATADIKQAEEDFAQTQASLKAVIKATGQETEVARQAEQDLLKARQQLAQEEIKDVNAIGAAWKELMAPVTEFFNSLGSGFKTMTNSIVQALLAPQVEIIHAGLTTIRETHRGQQISQAVSQMLLHAINSAVDSVESAVGKMFTNMLSTAVGSAPSEGLSGIFGKLFGGAVGGALPGAAAQSAQLATTTASQTAFNAALTTSTSTLLSHSAATATATSAEAARTSIVGVNTVTTTGNTVATTGNTLATATNSAEQTAAGASSVGGGLLKFLTLGILEKGGIIPSAQGGMVVGGLGSATLALLHPNEMVLPAAISRTIQGMTQSFAGGGGGNANLGGVNYAPQINMGGGGISPGEFRSMLASHASTIVGEARQLVRGGLRFSHKT